MERSALSHAVADVALRRRGKRRGGALAFVAILFVSIVAWLALYMHEPSSGPTAVSLHSLSANPAQSATVDSTEVRVAEGTAVPSSGSRFEFHVPPRFGMAPLDDEVIASATPVKFVRCLDGSSLSVGIPTLHGGNRWELRLFRDAISVIAVATRTPAVGGDVQKQDSVVWTRDDALLRELSQGATPHFGPHWIEVHLVAADALPTTIGSVTAFMRPVAALQTHTRYAARLTINGTARRYRVLAHLLFSRFEHLNELREEAAFAYSDPASSEQEHLAAPAGDVCVDVASFDDRTTERFGVTWASDGLYRDNEKRGALAGYWLPVKGEQGDPSIPYFQHDILGRMNFGLRFSWPADGSTGSPVEPCDRACFLAKLRDRTIYFIGDSHIRILFYGFLSRMRIPYPANKVWRGDRTDIIASHNVTIKFVAAYFLNLTRPSVMAAMMDDSNPVIVAGVGQHHSCHCWALAKHLDVVRSAVSTLVNVGPSAATSIAKRRRDVVWFGVPAQPVNRHLHIPKPVGQSRRDCRNNARHLLYNEAQKAIVRAAKPSIGRIAFLDAFELSVGMTHTSLDGAHYYTWVRDAWIDHLARAIAAPSGL